MASSECRGNGEERKEAHQWLPGHATRSSHFKYRQVRQFFQAHVSEECKEMVEMARKKRKEMFAS
jgi:hypothetical protein